jgi:hypothetical protein
MKKQNVVLISVVLLLAAAVTYYCVRVVFVGEPKASASVLPPDPDVGILTKNLQAKDRVVADLIARQITLVEAAEHFQSINALRPSKLQVYPLPFPGRTEQERTCRQVIFYVHTKLEGRPAHDAVVAGLEADLQKVLAADRAAPVGPVMSPKTSID